MRRVVDRLASPEAAAVLGNNAPVLANDDAIGIGLNLDRPADRAGADRVAFLNRPIKGDWSYL